MSAYSEKKTSKKRTQRTSLKVVGSMNRGLNAHERATEHKWLFERLITIFNNQNDKTERTEQIGSGREKKKKNYSHLRASKISQFFACHLH